jgi:hypothetical protein
LNVELEMAQTRRLPDIPDSDNNEIQQMTRPSTPKSSTLRRFFHAVQTKRGPHLLNILGFWRQREQKRSFDTKGFKIRPGRSRKVQPQQQGSSPSTAKKDLPKVPC